MTSSLHSVESLYYYLYAPSGQYKGTKLNPDLAIGPLGEYLVNEKFLQLRDNTLSVQDQKNVFYLGTEEDIPFVFTDKQRMMVARLS